MADDLMNTLMDINQATQNLNSEWAGNALLYPQMEKKLIAFIISLPNDSVATASTRKLIQSIRDTNSDVNPFIMPATTPETLETDLKSMGYNLSQWTWPIVPLQKKIDLATGLTMTGYGAKDYKKVIACLVSHMRIWRMAALFKTPLMILEQDALFTRKFDLNDVIHRISPNDMEVSAIGLNHPGGATRKASVFLDKVIQAAGKTEPEFDRATSKLVDAPWVEDMANGGFATPQGLAGNSAYIITTWGAARLFRQIAVRGLWPNDALMCKQLMKTPPSDVEGETYANQLKVLYPFVTKVQGTPSTTQG